MCQPNNSIERANVDDSPWGLGNPHSSGAVMNVNDRMYTCAGWKILDFLVNVDFLFMDSLFFCCNCIILIDASWTGS